MIISISGALGAGKSTLATKLAKKLKWPRYYIGGLRREAAKKRGMTLAEYNKMGEKDPSTDLEVDKYQEKLGKTKNNFVIEGRTSWHFIPHSIKFYLDVDEKIGAERILESLKNKDDRNEDKNLKTVRDVLKSNRTRIKSDKKRYKKYFDIDVYDQENYDFVIDTSKLDKSQVFDKIYKIIKENLEKTPNIDNK